MMTNTLPLDDAADAVAPVVAPDLNVAERPYTLAADLQQLAEQVRALAPAAREIPLPGTQAPIHLHGLLSLLPDLLQDPHVEALLALFQTRAFDGPVKASLTLGHSAPSPRLQKTEGLAPGWTAYRCTLTGRVFTMPSAVPVPRLAFEDADGVAWDWNIHPELASGPRDVLLAAIGKHIAQRWHVVTDALLEALTALSEGLRCIETGLPLAWPSAALEWQDASDSLKLTAP